MTTLAITGHQGLPEHTVSRVDRELREVVAGHGPLVGLSCLADGADQLFAQAVVDCGAKLEVIVPAEKYRAGLAPEAHAIYDHLFSQAARVHRLGFVDSTAESHLQASQLLVDMADALVAVWDGKPPRGRGGTADIVAYARQVGVPVTVVWPPGATRD